MKFVKQRQLFSIINFDKIVNKKALGKNVKKHGDLLPNSIRCIICGPSNCGKTNIMFNLLFSPKGLYFENVYVFSKSLYQNKYKFLQCVLNSTSEIEYFSFSENESIPHPSDIKNNSIMIFDDVSCGKQDNIKEYFSMGRHFNCDTFYICQTYSYVPKQLVRDNANFIIVFKQDERNLSHIYHDHVNTDMSYDSFKLLCIKTWNKTRNSFVTINKDCDISQGRYRAGLDTFIRL